MNKDGPLRLLQLALAVPPIFLTIYVLVLLGLAVVNPGQAFQMAVASIGWTWTWVAIACLLAILLIETRLRRNRSETA